MLDALFEAARTDDRAAARPDLLARVLADAEALQPTLDPLKRRDKPRKSVFAQLFGALGGWPSVTGLAAATVAGVWVGFVATPELLPNGVASLIGADTEIYLAYLEGGSNYGLEE
ncbi:hypothetical protein SAMN05444000_11225 [Shimia gijangensis]|uniref:Dihydroorotate dehydrogenase n=2 Tax=Shimia gijangensis TaxID=1470563 RepID=A0A1M6LK74_9RHOB|nr:hypothetical protein SAMN05444000_11225 [Shimia gijangensis]